MTTYTEAIILAEQCLNDAEAYRRSAETPDNKDVWDGFIQGIKCVIRRLEQNDPYHVIEDGSPLAQVHRKPSSTYQLLDDSLPSGDFRVTFGVTSAE